jgi:hypothetical protein
VWGQGGEMNQALYAHMNNKRKKKRMNGETSYLSSLMWHHMKDSYMLNIVQM